MGFKYLKTWIYYHQAENHATVLQEIGNFSPQIIALGSQIFLFTDKINGCQTN